MRAALVLPALAAALALGSTAYAQLGQGTLTGKIVDASTGNPVGDVVVTVTSVNLQGEEIAVTGKDGTFRISSLPPGDYTLRLDKESYKPYSRSDIKVRADVTLRVDMQVLPEALKEDIVVVGRRPTVDIGSSTASTNIGEDFLTRIPIIRPGGKGSDTRSIESAAAAVPQAAGDTYGTSINGTTSPENSYLLDGLSVGDPAYGTLGTPLSMEFVRELNVITGGYMPEYGKTTGGILNAVTKSGSNEFHAGIWAYFSPGALEGPREKIRVEGSTVDTQVGIDNIYDFGADFGGPIIPDTLWFYVGFDYATTRWKLDRSLRRILYDADGNELTEQVGEDTFTQTELIPGTKETFYAESHTLQVFGKFDLRIDKANRLSLTLVGAPRSSGGGGAYGMDPQDGSPEATNLVGAIEHLAHQWDGGTFDAVLKWNSELLEKKLILDTTIGWHHQTGGERAYDGSEPGDSTGLASQNGVIWRRTPNATGTRNYHSITEFESLPAGQENACDAPASAPGAVPCPVLSYQNGGPGFLDTLVLNRIGFQTILTWLPELAGKHVVKVGFDLDQLMFHHVRGYGGGTLYRESTSGTSFTDLRQYGFLTGPDQAVILPALDIETSSTSVGGFIQDSWSITDNLTLNFGVRYDAQFIYGGAGQLALSLPNQWSPRFGVIWDPSADGRAKLFANIALFYESVPLDIADRAGSGEPQITSIHFASECDPSDPTQAQGSCLDDSSRAYITEPASPDKLWVLTGSSVTPVDPDLSAQSSWEFVAGGEYDLGSLAEPLTDLRAGLMYTRRWMNNVIEDMSRDEAATYFIGNPGSGIAKDFPEATRDYNALTLYFQKEFSNSWIAQLSYTLSWLKGNYAGLFRPETGQLDPNINSDFDLESLTVNKEGYLPGDSRHVIKLFVANDIPVANILHIQPGLAVRASSGGPTSFLGSHPIYGSDEVFILPRGAGERLPWVTSIDFHAGFEFKITETYSIALTMDIFNLFNFQAVTGKSDRYTSADVLPIRDGSKADLATKLQYADGTAFDESDINPNFGRTTSYQRPRTFRFGLRGSL
ncbi:MAG: TonB-dependent receptor [Deltaproteobacteria bacterium]|nr:TonB-dependent receptor [Deltaproteobacteria bacterium]